MHFSAKGQPSAQKCENALWDLSSIYLTFYILQRKSCSSAVSGVLAIVGSGYCVIESINSSEPPFELYGYDKVNSSYSTNPKLHKSLENE